jgi:ribonuclease HI
MLPSDTTYELCIQLDFGCTNNQAKYEALFTGLEVLAEVGARRAEIFCDSKLVIQKINGESQCLDGVLNEYKEECVFALANFEKVSIQHVQRKDNEMANALAQQAWGIKSGGESLVLGPGQRQVEDSNKTIVGLIKKKNRGETKKVA